MLQLLLWFCFPVFGNPKHIDNKNIHPFVEIKTSSPTCKDVRVFDIDEMNDYNQRQFEPKPMQEVFDRLSKYEIKICDVDGQNCTSNHSIKIEGQCVLNPIEIDDSYDILCLYEGFRYHTGNRLVTIEKGENKYTLKTISANHRIWDPELNYLFGKPSSSPKVFSSLSLSLSPQDTKQTYQIFGKKYKIINARGVVPNTSNEASVEEYLTRRQLWDIDVQTTEAFFLRSSFVFFEMMYLENTNRIESEYAGWIVLEKMD